MLQKIVQFDSSDAALGHASVSPMSPGYRVAVACVCVVSAAGCQDKKQAAETPPQTSPVKTERPPTSVPTPPITGRASKGDSKVPRLGTTTRKRAVYSKALARGRKLAAKRPLEAVKAFEEALIARPDDPTALSELSWAWVNVGEFDRAVAAAERSIVGATKDRALRAASLYNLGRGKEGRKDKVGAIKAYEESYRLRQHPAVKKRLEALGGTAPKSIWVGVALSGPYQTAANFCAEFSKQASGSAECSPDLDSTSTSKLVAPWGESAGVIETSDAASDLPSLHLVFRASGGLYVLRDFEKRGNRYSWTFEGSQLEGATLLIHHSNEEGRFETDVTRLITICSANTTGRPSCVGPTAVYSSYTGYEGTKEEGTELPEQVYFDCEAKLASATRVQIMANDAGCKRKTGLPGTHELAF